MGASQSGMNPSPSADIPKTTTSEELCSLRCDVDTLVHELALLPSIGNERDPTSVHTPEHEKQPSSSHTHSNGFSSHNNTSVERESEAALRHPTTHQEHALGQQTPRGAEMHATATCPTSERHAFDEDSDSDGSCDEHGLQLPSALGSVSFPAAAPVAADDGALPTEGECYERVLVLLVEASRGGDAPTAVVSPTSFSTNLSSRCLVLRLGPVDPVHPPCARVMCLRCDMPVLQFPRVLFLPWVHYLFLRNAYPSPVHLARGMRVAEDPNTVAYVCQCTWRNVTVQEEAARSTDMHWCCVGH